MSTMEEAQGLKLYRRRQPWAWWLQNPRYLLFMLRDISSIFVAVWAVLWLVQIAQLAAGRQAYEGFVSGFLRSPWMLVFSVIALAFALLHSVTWLQLAGVVQVVKVGERRLPARYVAGGAFASWLVASIVIGVFLVGG